MVKQLASEWTQTDEKIQQDLKTAEYYRLVGEMKALQQRKAQLISELRGDE